MNTNNQKRELPWWFIALAGAIALQFGIMWYKANHA